MFSLPAVKVIPSDSPKAGLPDWPLSYLLVNTEARLAWLLF